MKEQLTSFSRTGLTRREILSACALAPGLALVSCRHVQSPPPSWANADRQIDRLHRAMVALGRREPNLPGFQSMSRIPRDLADGLSLEDRVLFTQAIYMDQREALQPTRRPITEAQIRQVLSTPLDVTRFDRGYAERRVAQAKQRIRTDSTYGNALIVVGHDPFGPNCVSYWSNQPMPCSLLGLCGVIAVLSWMEMWPP